MKRRRHFASQCPKEAFTLVELMTAVTVLTLLVITFAQIIAIASQSTGLSLRRADSVGQARMILDRFGLDWDARLRRSDLLPSFSQGSGQASGNDAVLFYSQVNGFGSGTLRPISEVGYFVLNSPYSLQRFDYSSTWTTTGNPLPFLSTAPAVSPPTFPTANYQTLADDICRFEFCFQLKSTGQMVSTPPANFSDVGAVVLGVAVLDKSTRKLITTNQISQLVSTLTVAPAGSTPQAQWTTNLAGASGTLSQIILANVRIFQRTFYAN